MRRAFAMIAAFMAAMALAIPAGAQERLLDLPIDDVDISGFPEVSVQVTVPFELVGLDLIEENFRIGENGKSRPLVVEQLPTDTLEIVLVLDTSGSMRGEPLEAAKAAVAAFAEQMPEGVEVAVVAFGSLPRVVSEFTTDLPSVVEAADAVTAGGETAVYDALGLATSLFDADVDTRRTVVLLSDGGDTASQTTLEQAIIDLLDAGVSFFAVELESPEFDPAPLQRIAAATGGEIVPAGDPVALAGIFAEIGSNLVNQYQLRFTAESTGATEILAAVKGAGVTAASTVVVDFPLVDPVPATTVAPEPAPVATTVAALREPIVVTPALADPTLLWIGAFMFFAGLTGLFLLFRTPSVGALKWEDRRKLAFKRGRNRETALRELTAKAATFAESKLGGSRRYTGVGAMLEQAGMAVRPGEFTVLMAGSAIGGFVLGSFTGGGFFAMILALLGVALPLMWLSIKANRRRSAFAEQLPDALQLISGGLRAGYGLLQAFEAVSNENLGPVSEELHRVRVEVQLGRELDDALEAMATRSGSEDFRWVAEAIGINRQVGGDLSEILDQVAATIRERERLRRQVKALSAEGRMSAVILIALPFGLALATTALNPGYLEPLFTTTPGKVMLFAGSVLMVVGTIWLRNIAKLKY